MGSARLDFEYLIIINAQVTQSSVDRVRLTAWLSTNIGARRPLEDV